MLTVARPPGSLGMGSVAAAASLVGSLVLWFLWSVVAEEAAEAEHRHVRCAATSLARAVVRGGGHAPQLLSFQMSWNHA